MRHTRKFYQIFITCLVALAIVSRCHAQVPQYINAWYQFKASEDSIGYRLPNTIPVAPYKKSGSIYFNPTDFLLNYWTGSAFRAIVYNASNGLTDSSGSVLLGGIVYKNTSLDLSKDTVYFLYKMPPLNNFDTVKSSTIIIGDTTFFPEWASNNFGPDTYKPFSSPIIINRAHPNGFNTIPLLYMTTNSSNNPVGIYFGLNSQSNRLYSPEMETYQNDSTAANGHAGFTHYLFMKSKPQGQSSFAYTLRIGNYDTLNKVGNDPEDYPVRNVNPFVIDNGNENVFFIDSLYNVKIGPTPFFIVSRARLDIYDNGKTSWGVLQEGLARNFFGGKVVIGGSWPSTDTSGILNLHSTTAGFSPPRMTTTQKLAISGANLTEGIQVYDLTLHQMSYFNGTVWVNF